MKRLLFIVILCFTITNSFAETAISKLVPHDVVMYLQTSRIKQLVMVANSVINLLPNKQRQEILAERDEMLKKTGIDIINTESLKNAGIDISKKIGMAILKKYKHEEQFLVYIPVYNEKTFPLKFAQMLNRAREKNNDKTIENYPVITSYKSGKIYQFWKDVFGTTFDDYFIIASDGDFVKKVIDLKEGGNSLDSDTHYTDYRKNINKTHDLNVFMKKDLLKDEYKREPIVAAIDYLSFSASFKSNLMRINAALKLNANNVEAKKILSSIKTGLAARSLYIPNVDTFAFLSFDLQNFDKMCKNFGTGCAEYSQLKQIFQVQYGVDIVRHVIPNYNGYINAMLYSQQNSMMQMNNVTFIAMKSEAKARIVWDNMKNHLKQFAKSKRFGTITISGRPAFWLLDEKMEKNYISYDKKGLYVGNNVELIGKALRQKTIQSAGSEIKNRMSNDVYFLLYIKKESFLGAMLMMQAQRDPELQHFINRLQSIFLTGKKNTNRVSFELDVLLKNK